MRKGLEFFQEHAFDPEMIGVLCDAYAKACKLLHDSGQPQLVNEIIARRIITLAMQGERDPEKLSDGAVKWAIHPREVG
jgi:hypothetical protein